jgi:hypothetical protein
MFLASFSVFNSFKEFPKEKLLKNEPCFASAHDTRGKRQACSKGTSDLMRMFRTVNEK